MKFGGQSWKSSQKSRKGVPTRFICKYCGRRYKMDWALQNHQKLCKEHWIE